MLNDKEMKEIQEAIARHEDSLGSIELEEYSDFEKLFDEIYQKLKERYIYNHQNTKEIKKELLTH